jgi:hypothetical protein
MWGASFLYVDDNTNCMVMMFEGDNPNKDVSSSFLPDSPSFLVFVVALWCAIM